MTDLDDRTLNSLTPAEREILAEDTAVLDDVEAPDSAPASESARADHSDDTGETELRRDPTPLWDTREPENAAERLASLAEEKAALISKFDYGEITAREYSDALEALDDRREDIRFAQRKARMASEEVEAAKDAAWGREVERFMTTTAKDIAAKGEGALLAFDSYVKKVTGDPANARLSDRAQLKKAHKLFEADFGKLPAGRAQRAETPAPGSAADHARDAADFSALDRLAETDPLAYQKRIGRMTPTEREEYGL